MERAVATKAGAKCLPPQPWHLLGFRGYMAFSVVFLHSAEYLPQRKIGTFFDFDVGARLRCHRGVLVFFMLSSFQLTYNLLWTVPLGRTHWTASVKLWGRYCLRRIFRIYPNYVAVLLFIKAFPAWYYDTPEDFSLWAHLTFRQSFHVFWTLPAEVEYYFVIPVLVLLYKAGESADNALASPHAPFPAFHNWRFRTLALLPFSLLALHHSQTRPFLDSSLSLPHFHIFFLGSLVGILLYNMQLSDQCKEEGGKLEVGTTTLGSLKLGSLLRSPKVAFGLKILHSVGVWALFCVSMDLLSLMSWYSSKGDLELALERPPHSIYLAACLALIFLSSAVPVSFPGTFNHVMASAPLLWAGKISYALYLSHPIAVQLVKVGVARNHPCPLSLVYSVAVLLALFIQGYIEVPGANVGLWLIRRLDRYLDQNVQKPSTSEVILA